LTATVAVGCLAGPAAASAATPVPDSPAKADKQLDRAMSNLVARPDGPLGAISVVQRGTDLSVHTAGLADAATGERPRKRMHMRIASTAKAFSGYVALDLVRDGDLALTDTIGQRLPDLPSAWQSVTLEQLMHHTGGIPDFTGSPGFGPAVGANPLNPPPPEELLSFVANKGLDPSAGTYAYSNSDNIVIGLMAAASRGSLYERELIARVIEPLDLGRTYLYSAPSVAEPAIHGYDIGDDNSRAPEDVTNLVDFGGWAWASGGIVSTPANLNKFIRSYISTTARLDDALFIQGGHSEPRGPGRNAAGLSVFRYETDCGTVYGHTGSILGYTQFMAATADGRRSVTFSINTQYSDGLLPKLRKVEERAVCAALA
jgi:D-alanyl-D-alanine carboxypeptidase